MTAERETTPPTDITVVILARNEERTIAEVIHAARPFCDAVLVMDGRSTDQTRRCAEEAGAEVRQDPGLGKGAAIRASLPLVRTEVVVFMDADGSHAAEDIPRLVLPIRRGEADLVVGSRFMGGSDEISATVPQLIRTVGNISMNIAINLRYGASLTDTLNGFRAIRTSVGLALKLKENRHTIEQEMVIQALRRGFRVLNVPTHEYRRKFGESTINIWEEWPIFVWCLGYNLALPKRIDTARRLAQRRPRCDAPR